MDNYLDCFI